MSYTHELLLLAWILAGLTWWIYCVLIDGYVKVFMIFPALPASLAFGAIPGGITFVWWTWNRIPKFFDYTIADWRISNEAPRGLPEKE